MSYTEDLYAVSAATLAGGMRAYEAALGEASTYWAGQWGRGATPFDYTADALRWYETYTRRQAPRWASANTVIYESPLVRLRDFSVEHPSATTPTLVLPPQAGHHSCIIDFARGQSQMQALLTAGLDRAYALEWLGATQKTKHTTVEDYLAELDHVVELLGGRINLIGDCQGGWMAVIYTALRPRAVLTLTVAGAPIDFQAAPEAALPRNVRALAPEGSMKFFEDLVAASGGIYPGRNQLAGFIALAPQSEAKRQVGLLNILGDKDALARYRDFEDWFRYTQDMPGDFYLWIVRELFVHNKLIAGELRVGGQTVKLSAIRCPTFMLAGKTDHITPPVQAFALSDYIAAAPADQLQLTAPGGHLGLFMGHSALRDHWPPILAEIVRRSQ